MRHPVGARWLIYSAATVAVLALLGLAGLVSGVFNRGSQVTPTPTATPAGLPVLALLPNTTTAGSLILAEGPTGSHSIPSCSTCVTPCPPRGARRASGAGCGHGGK
ncbi:MAG: hypothetical protein HZY76_09375 [Anaerolineae bacterium]|nr:MAG: hypothetical protein HZY76_09375 [Anaerolineae bacterium]